MVSRLRAPSIAIARLKSALLCLMEGAVAVLLQHVVSQETGLNRFGPHTNSCIPSPQIGAGNVLYDEKKTIFLGVLL